MGASFTSESLAQDDIRLIVPNNSASASQEPGAKLALERGLVNSQTMFPHQGKWYDIGDKQVHLGSQSVCSADKDGMKCQAEACEIAGNDASAGSKIWESPSPSSFPNDCEEGQSDDSSSSNINQYPTNPVLMTQAITQGRYSTDTDFIMQAIAQGQYVACVHDNAKASEMQCIPSELCCMRGASSKHTAVWVVRPNGY